MNLTKQVKEINWLRIVLFYGIVLGGTFLARKLPNVLNLLLEKITDIPFSFNFNHGLVTLIVALLFYQFSGVKQSITLLGDKGIKSLLFPAVLFVCYGIYGMGNDYEVNRHLWALLFCAFALVYNIMEEYAWRGYLIDSLGNLNVVFKSILSGVFWSVWHLLVFNNFDQYGGFWIFFAFCIVFSFLLTLAVFRTKSILVAATIHAFIIQINLAALMCVILFVLLLLTWNKQWVRK